MCAPPTLLVILPRHRLRWEEALAQRSQGSAWQSSDRYAPTRNPRLAIPIWGKHLNAIMTGLHLSRIGLGMQLTSADSIPGVNWIHRHHQHKALQTL
jgi:hypothetical protein